MEHKKPTQDELSRFVDRQVYYCCSSLVSELYDKYPDELTPVMMQDDWETPAIDYIKDNDCSDEFPDIQTKEQMVESLRVNNLFADFCQHHDLEPDTNEALEHWIVSNWLADRLREQGEMVINNFLGLTIWGRTCSGQAILLDGVIERIYSNMME